MPLGMTLAQLAGSSDPGAMLASIGQGWWAAAMIVLASVTTNFVNIYMSSLAWRTIRKQTPGAVAVWSIGLIGTVLGLISSVWLTRFADLMVWLGSILVPVGGVFLAHFVVLRRRIDVDAIYDITRTGAFNAAGIVAWLAGFIVYKLAAPIGATLPALATSILVYCALAARRR
jgi:purine-cytosine permease-like protein